MNFIQDGGRETLNDSETKFIKGSPTPLFNSRGRNNNKKFSMDPIKRVGLKGELNLTSITSEIIKQQKF